MSGPRMRPPGVSAREFEDLSVGDVSSTSLSWLAKNLHPDTSKHATFSAYFRWLEVHRKNTSHFTIHWSNALMHWVQSLESRGFSGSEIIDEVDGWTAANGPFHSTLGRFPPTHVDIRKALKSFPSTDDKTRGEKIETMGRGNGDSWRPSDSARGERYGEMPSSGSGRRGNPKERPKHKRNRSDTNFENPKVALKRKAENAFDGPPPPNYVCNRCGKKGHHLQVCPTNLDPTYDKPPAQDYICEICNARGEHFKSLCPRNTDPYSIIQKRKAKGIQSPPVKGTSRILSEWERDSGNNIEMEETERGLDRDPREKIKRENPDSLDQEYGQSTQESLLCSSPSQPSQGSSKRAETMEILQEIEDRRSRLFREESADLEELIREGELELGGGVKRRRIQDPSYGNQVSSTSSPLIVIRAKDESTAISDMTLEEEDTVDRGIEETNDTMDLDHPAGDFEIDLESDQNKEMPGEPRTGDPQSLSASTKKRETFEIPSNDGIATESSDETEVGIQKLVKVYCNFVQNLLIHYPKMSESVNPATRRPTARDMWKRDGGRRVQETGIGSSVQSPEQVGFSSEKDEEEDRFGHKQDDEPLGAQFDGAGEERYDEEINSRQRQRISSAGSIGAITKSSLGKLKTMTKNFVKDLPVIKSHKEASYSLAISPPEDQEDHENAVGADRNYSMGPSNGMGANSTGSPVKLTHLNMATFEGENYPNLRPPSKDSSKDSWSSVRVNHPHDYLGPTEKFQRTPEFDAFEEAVTKEYFNIYKTPLTEGEKAWLAVVKNHRDPAELQALEEALKLNTHFTSEAKDPPTQKGICGKALRNASESYQKISRPQFPRTSTGRGAQDWFLGVDKSDIADLKEFSKNFKLKGPIPSEIVELMAKDPSKHSVLQETPSSNKTSSFGGEELSANDVKATLGRSQTENNFQNKENNAESM